MDAVLAFVPPEERVRYSAMTGQALYYLADADLKHQILAIVEEEGAERASYALKLLQSEGELTIASTGKDPHTGRMVTQEYRVEGPVMIFLTTTAMDIDEELLNRCLVLTVDEGREQTAAHPPACSASAKPSTGSCKGSARSEVLGTPPGGAAAPAAARRGQSLRRAADLPRRPHPHAARPREVPGADPHASRSCTSTSGRCKTVQQGGKTLAYIEATLDDIAARQRARARGARPLPR